MHEMCVALRRRLLPIDGKVQKAPLPFLVMHSEPQSSGYLQKLRFFGCSVKAVWARPMVVPLENVERHRPNSLAGHTRLSVDDRRQRTWALRIESSFEAHKSMLQIICCSCLPLLLLVFDQKANRPKT